MNEEIWGMEVGDPVEDDHTQPILYSEVKQYKHVVPSTTIMRWTKGEIVFLIILGLAMMGLVIFTIVRDAPHP
jgi:hypothetical protein